MRGLTIDPRTYETEDEYMDRYEHAMAVIRAAYARRVYDYPVSPDALGESRFGDRDRDIANDAGRILDLYDQMTR